MSGERHGEGRTRGRDAPRVPIDTCSPCVRLPCQQLCSVPIPREAPPVLAVGEPWRRPSCRTRAVGRHVQQKGMLRAVTPSQPVLAVGFATGPGAHPRGNNTLGWWKPSVRFPSVGQMEEDTCFL